MLIKFESEGAASFEMLGTHAVLLISLMGHKGKEEGSISGPAIPAALSKLDAGLEQLNNPQEEPPEEDDDEEPPVSLNTRAIPLKELLHHAAKNETYLMWRRA
jgi:hypothetical protein